MIGIKERKTVIGLENLRDIWNCSRLYKIALLALLYLSCTILESLGISSKGLGKIIRIEIRSPRTVSIIARLSRQSCEGAKVSKVDNIERLQVPCKDH